MSLRKERESLENGRKREKVNWCPYSTYKKYAIDVFYLRRGVPLRFLLPFILLEKVNRG
jgi:hypothetical protein